MRETRNLDLEFAARWPLCNSDIVFWRHRYNFWRHRYSIHNPKNRAFCWLMTFDVPTQINKSCQILPKDKKYGGDLRRMNGNDHTIQRIQRRRLCWHHWLVSAHLISHVQDILWEKWIALTALTRWKVHKHVVARSSSSTLLSQVRQKRTYSPLKSNYFDWFFNSNFNWARLQRIIQ